MRAKMYGIFNVQGELVEGGFFSKDAAQRVCETEYSNCVVRLQK